MTRNSQPKPGKGEASLKRRFQRCPFSLILLLVLFLVLGRAAAGHAQTVVSGTITTDTTWTLAGSPYQVTGSVTVNQGVTLTIDAGVRVEFSHYTALNVNGTLRSVGSSGQPILFTGSTEGTPGWWVGIYVAGGGSADLEYCTIAYAGYSYQYAGLHKSGSGALTLKNSTMDQSAGAGLYLNGTTGVFTSSGNTFSNNVRGVQVAIDTSFEHDDTSTFSGNTSDVYLNNGTMTGEVSWYLNPAYSMHLSGNITVAEGALLQVLPGTVIKAAHYVILTVAGSLAAQGEAGKAIAFTDWRDDAVGGDANGDAEEIPPTPGWWAGIYVTGSGSADLAHCTIAYAGYSYQYAGLHKSGSGALTLINSTMDHSFGAGLYLNGTTGAFTSSGNTFSNNAQGIRVAIDTSFEHDDTSTFSGNTSDVYLNNGTMTGEVSWYLNPAYSMHLSGNITVAEGALLRVLPGTVIKAAHYAILTVAGSLAAQGEAGKAIAFTDWRDDAVGGDANGDAQESLPTPGWWAGIYVTGGGSADLAHCTIAYAGYSYQHAGLHKSGSGALTLNNSTMDHSAGAGLQIMAFEGKWLQEGVDGEGDGYLYGAPPSDGSTSYFIAPEAYHGDWRNYTELRLSLWSTDGEYIGEDTHASWRGDIYLANGAMFAYTMLPRRPAATWDQFSVSLTDPGIEWVFGGGAESLVDVLANVTAFHVRAEYAQGPTYTGLDRVELFESIQDAPKIASYFPENQTDGWAIDIGKSLNPAGLGKDGALTASGNTFSNNVQGIQIAIDTSFQHDDTSTFSANTYDVYLNSGTMTGEVSWYLNPAYSMHLSGNMTVAEGALLRVLPGTVVKAAYYAKLTISGALEAQGEAGRAIAFTDWRDDAVGGDANGDADESLPVPGWWAGIYVAGSGSADLEYCTIAYAGYSYQYAGLHKSGSGALTLKNSTMDHTYGSGLYIDGITGTFTSSGNTFSNNAQGIRVAIDTSFEHDDTSTFSGNTYDVYLNSGTMTGEVSWYLNPAYSMHLSGNITVAEGALLRVLPGTVIKAAHYAILTVSGSLAAQGEAGKAIAFTDWRDDAVGGDANGDAQESLPTPGWWAGIYVTGSGSADLAHCTIAYAGFSYQYAGLYKSGSGDLILKRSTSRKVYGSGLYINNSTGGHEFERNTFTENTTGVNIVNQAEPLSLSGNLIEGNTEYGMRSQSSAEVDARNNWWGHPSGPQHDGLNPEGQGDTVSDGVVFEPWRTTPSAGEILSPIRSGSLVARDLLRFSGSVASEPDATYLWRLSDGRSYSERVPGLISFPESGAVTVSYAATPEAGEDPYPDTRSFTVVPDTGNLPDLRVIQVGVAGTLAVGQPAQIAYTVRNVGQGPAGSAWKDTLYLSQDAYLDITDIFLGSVAVNRNVPAGQSYQNAVNVTLPAVDEGAYNLILVANDEWQILELHRLNNEYATQITAQVPVLTDGEAQTISYAAGLVEQYFRMTAPAGQNLVLDLTNVPQGPEVFIRFGALPTQGAYDYRLQGGERFVIPAAAAGQWYVLVYGNMAQDGQYAIQFDMAQVALTASSPSRHGTAVDLELSLTGAGFAYPLGVDLVSGQGTIYGADEVAVDSFSQAGATFAAGTVPAGTYAVRVSRDGQTAQLSDAIEIVTGGQPKLQVNLILPSRFGYHQLATVYLEYKNTGDAPMPAPLLMVTAFQKNRQAAMLTLDQSRLSSGFWTSAMPEGFAESVQFLASGNAAGILQAGESRRIPVYYAGWQQPWDFSYPPFEWLVGVLDSENGTFIDWDALKGGTRPEYIAEDAWEVVWNNFTSLAGNTWGDYVAMLSRNASYLYRHGQRIEEISALQAFTFRQAEGFSPVAELASGIDAVVQGPGLPMTFQRDYRHQISRRFVLGPLGRGWTHNWQFALQTEEDETVKITDPSGTPRIFQPDSRYTGRFLAQAGDEGGLRVVTGGYRLTEQDGTIQFFSSDGKLSYIEDTNGNRIACAYDGDLLTSLTHSSGPVITIAYNGDGRIASVTDPHGRQTLYAYTGEYLSSIEKYDDRTTTYNYNTAAGASQHAMIEVGMPDGNTLTYTYDDRGRLSSAYRNDGEEKVRFSHTGVGRVEVTNVLDHTSRFFFDHWGRMFKTENDLGEAVQKSFDDLGRLVGVTDPDGFSTDFAYDRQGNLIAATDAMHRVTRFAYTREFNRLASVTDALNNTTSYGYDDQGNLTDKTYPGGHKESWTYDVQGNPASWTNRRGATLTFDYDDAGRITRKEFADGSSAVYQYDARGNLVETEDGQGTTAFTYNDHDYLMSVVYPGGRWLAFEYDDVGRRAFSEDQLGHRVGYHYDADGRLSRLSNGAGDIVTYAYDELGRLAQKAMGNGLYTTYQYDPVGRLLEMVNYGPDDIALSSFAYTYDRRGRRTSMQTRYGVWTYGYDDVGQLIRAVLQSIDPEIQDQDITYEYDASGNRVRRRVSGQDDTYDTNNLNQYTRVGDRTYTYDSDGNLVREEGPDGAKVYTYNDQNRLIGIAHGGDTWQYTYDALGNRVAVDENGAVTHYVHDPVGLGNVVGEYDNAGDLVTRYTHGIGLVSQAAEGATNYYTFDPMGNTSEVSGAAGALQNRYAYRPFGETILASQTVGNPLHFMGEFGVMTAPAGLHYVRARHYDARAGRFTSMDPIGFLGGDINLYRYVMNSPLDGVDPTGLLNDTQKCGMTRGVVNIVSGGVRVVAGAYTSAAVVGIPVMVWGGADMFYGVFQFFMHGALGGPGRGDYMRHFDHSNVWTAVLKGNDVSEEKVWWVETGLLAENLVNSPFVWVATSIGADKWCAYNQNSVSTFGGCPISRTSSSSSRTPLDVSPIRQALSASACMPFRPVIFGEAGLAASHDPNQKLGPMGALDYNFLRTSSPFSYQIDFENLETATAPAQVVTIRDPLSPHLDLTTFELSQIGFGGVSVPVPAGSKSFETVMDYAYKDDDYDFVIEVHINAWVENGIFHVNFISIDPETGLPPQDVGVGFLPPENQTGRGQGFVSYMINAKPDLPSGTEIRNIADIQFDFGLTIGTNQVDPSDPSQGTDPDKEALITVDSVVPASRVAALPETTLDRTFTLLWSGEDDEQGSGVRDYEIYVSMNGGPYTHWLTTTATSAMFTGECWQQYSFYSVAVDYAGNMQQSLGVPDATIEILSIRGDADASGQVDLADLLHVLQVHSQIVSGQMDTDVCADVDGDGRVGIAEAIYVLQVVSEMRKDVGEK